MQKKNLLETIMGAVVLIAAAVFLVFAYEGSQLRVEEGYEVSAKFSNATGIALGSDVRVGGIKVGVVSGLDLDPQTYEAVLKIQIRNGTKMPEDSSASIVSSGLLGEKFIQLTPGADEKMLAEGGKIQFTQSSVSLEELIGKFMFSGGGVDKGGEEEKAADAGKAKKSSALPTLE
ncbi:MAG: outer membrane lipid asymmetry maintenance protein MlaD [Rickettsiales bacterium]|nr:outer membrane lipid asymmetry maintenance protein MlaD [Rickettsiales bacterium]